MIETAIDSTIQSAFPGTTLESFESLMMEHTDELNVSAYTLIAACGCLTGHPSWRGGALILQFIACASYSSVPSSATPIVSCVRRSGDDIGQCVCT